MASSYCHVPLYSLRRQQRHVLIFRVVADDYQTYKRNVMGLSFQKEAKRCLSDKPIVHRDFIFLLGGQSYPTAHFITSSLDAAIGGKANRPP